MNRVAIIFLIATSAAAQSKTDISSAAAAIQQQDIKAKMFFLSDAEMSGRLVGTH